MMRSPTLRRVVLCLGLLTLLRLACIGRIELSPDEAYYQMWSERLDWAYYSKGPGIAVIIRAGTALFGVNEFGVRFFAPLFALGTSLLIFLLARRLYNERVAAWAVLLINVTPIFQAGALLMTIDAPSIFFWTAALSVFESAARSREAALGRWLLTGALIGLGYLCKYTNAVELFCAGLALGIVPGWRRHFRAPGFYAMLLAAAVAGAPPAIWNSQHAWITLDHLRSRGRLDDAAFHSPFREAADFWGAQLGVYSPLIMAGILVAIGWGWRRARLRAEAEKTRLLLAFGLPLLVMYGLLAFKTAGEANWTAPTYIALSILAAAFWHERAERSRAAARYCGVALGVGLVCSAVILNTDAIRAAGVPWPYARDPGARLLGWRSTAQAVAAFRQEEERQLGAPVFLIANRYQLAAELHFYLPAPSRLERAGDPPVYLPESQNIENQFSLWPGYDQLEAKAPDPGARPAGGAEEEFRQVGANPLVGRCALYLTDNERERRVPGSIESGFEENRLVAKYEIRRRGLPLRHLRVYACFHYKGLEL